MPNTVSAKEKRHHRLLALTPRRFFTSWVFRQNSISCSEGVNKRTAHSLSPPAHRAANFGVRESDKERDPAAPFEGGAGTAHFSCRATKKCSDMKLHQQSLSSTGTTATAAQKSENVADVLLVSISAEIVEVCSSRRPSNGKKRSVRLHSSNLDSLL